MKSISLPNSYNYISAFLTLRCNLDCSFCVNKASDKDIKRNFFKELSGKEWVEALNRIEAPKEVPISFVGGEPSLHKDFIFILNHLKPELGVDIFTNLWWGERKLEKFLKEVSPDRIDNHAPFPSIRASYHPEQMGGGERLLKNAIMLKKEGFDVGIEGVMYPSPFQLEALEKMDINCRNEGINFRPKSFIGVYEGVDDLNRPFSILHGDYSKYKGATLSKETSDCKCKTSNLLINPDGNVHRCQRDLLLQENPLGNILDKNFQIKDSLKFCSNYGQCHPCDVKVKTDNKQRLGTTLVEIVK